MQSCENKYYVISQLKVISVQKTFLETASTHLKDSTAEPGRKYPKLSNKQTKGTRSYNVQVPSKNLNHTKLF